MMATRIIPECISRLDTLSGAVVCEMTKSHTWEATCIVPF